MSVKTQKKQLVNKSQEQTYKVYDIKKFQRTLWITCFEEQLLFLWEDIIAKIKEIDPLLYQVMAIYHDKDNGKPHYHIAIKVMGNERKAIEELLKLVGVQFRIPGEDEVLCKQGALQTCNEDKLCKGFESKALYMIHATPASEADGKYPYKDSEIVSNLSQEQVHDMVVERKQVHENAKKITMLQLAELDEQAYRLGLAFGDFEEWEADLPYTVRRKASDINTMRKRYNKGVLDAIATQGKTITRLAIFIQGESDQGKTWAALEALSDRESILIKESGTGQYDELKPTTDVIVVDDQCVPDVLNMADNYRAQARRRNSGRPWWCGRYFIVTSNLGFKEWLNECGVKHKTQIEAATSRFFICHVEKKNGVNRLYCDHAAFRGSDDMRKEQIEMFNAFRKAYDHSLATYIKTNQAFSDAVLGFGDGDVLPEAKDETAKPTYGDLEEEIVNLRWQVKNLTLQRDQAWEELKAAGIWKDEQFE